MDFIKDWAGELLAGGVLMMTPLLWRIGTAYVAKKIGEAFVRVVDYLLERGDKDCDVIVYAIAKKVAEEIEDGMGPKHPKIVYWSANICKEHSWLIGKNEYVEVALSSVLKQIDKRAKQYETRPTKEGN